MERHTILDGKIHIYRRPNSRKWHCSTSLAGVEHRKGSGKDLLDQAKLWAEEWYFGLIGKQRAGLLTGRPTFADVAPLFENEYLILTRGERSPLHVENVFRCIRVHLLPYFGSMPVAAITQSVIQEYRMFRLQGGRGDPRAVQPALAQMPARATIKKELTALRMALGTAARRGWIPGLPDFSSPYRESTKVSHRGWFSPEEYRQLYLATRRRAKDPLSPRWKHACEQLHDYVLFMANTGLRPDEAKLLQYRDVSVVLDKKTQETILEIEVRGKRGYGWCKSTPGAVRPFQRMLKRNQPQPTDRLFPSYQRELLNSILREEGLKVDREGNRRSAYSLRHTYICLRLLEGAKPYHIAKNCRTSIEMIEKHYAVHIKHMLDASEINARRSRRGERFYDDELRADADSAGLAA